MSEVERHGGGIPHFVSVGPRHAEIFFTSLIVKFIVLLGEWIAASAPTQGCIGGRPPITIQLQGRPSQCQINSRRVTKSPGKATARMSKEPCRRRSPMTSKPPVGKCVRPRTILNTG